MQSRAMMMGIVSLPLRIPVLSAAMFRLDTHYNLQRRGDSGGSNHPLKRDFVIRVDLSRLPAGFPR